MARPADPERLYEARRIAVRNRLLDEVRIRADAVDVWLAAWQVEAAGRGLDRFTGAYWEGAAEWIVERYCRRSK